MGDSIKLARRPDGRMDCEFCDEHVESDDPENLQLLSHLRESKACSEQFGYLLENLRTSWTPAMSGG